MTTTRRKRAFLWLLRNTVNRAALRAARSGRGPFSLVRHVGRRTGTRYETPLILARVDGGFIAELTYGPDVAWYQNVTAATSFVVVVNGAEHVIDAIEDYPTRAGRRAFGPKGLILTLLRRREFRFLREASDEVDDGTPPTTNTV